MLSNLLILSHSLLLLPSIFPSIRVFSNESALLIIWPKYWSLSFSISPSSEYSGLISFRIDWWFDLLAVQGTLKNLLQHYNSKALIPWYLAFFIVQLLRPYMTTGKMEFSWLEYWTGFPFPPPVDQGVSELFTMTCPSWVTLHGMAHSFIELCKPLLHHKAVIHERVTNLISWYM